MDLLKVFRLILEILITFFTMQNRRSHKLFKMYKAAGFIKCKCVTGKLLPEDCSPNKFPPDLGLGLWLEFRVWAGQSSGGDFPCPIE